VRERRDEGLFLVEGPRGVEEALAAHAALAWVLVGASRVERPPHAALLERCARAGVPVQPVADELLERIAPTERGPGLLAACQLPAHADDFAAVAGIERDGVLPIAWDVRDPGNLGTLLRSAAAFGALGFVSAGGADPWNPKAVRASAGAIHTLPTARTDDPVAALAALPALGYRAVAATPRGGAPPGTIDWSGRVALVLGSEVAGLPPKMCACAQLVTIAMAPGVESLSVAIAGAILLHRTGRVP